MHGFVVFVLLLVVLRVEGFRVVLIVGLCALCVVASDWRLDVVLWVLFVGAYSGVFACRLVWLRI